MRLLFLARTALTPETDELKEEEEEIEEEEAEEEQEEEAHEKEEEEVSNFASRTKHRRSRALADDARRCARISELILSNVPSRCSTHSALILNFGSICSTSFFLISLIYTREACEITCFL